MEKYKIINLQEALTMLTSMGYLVKGLTCPESWGKLSCFFYYYARHYRKAIEEISEKAGDSDLRFLSRDLDAIFCVE